MASKGRKKKRNVLLILFACILVCAGGYGLLSLYDAKQEKEEENGETEEMKLLSMKSDSISKIEFENSFGSMKLCREDGTWFWENDRKFPLNQDYAEDMADTVSDLEALRLIVKEPENLEDFGLKDPEITINFHGSQGEAALYLGDKSPSADNGYYCRLNDEQTIYEVDASVFTAFNYSNSQMMVLEDVPEITATQVTKLDIKNPKEFDFTAVNKAIGDSSSWSIRAPYSNAVVGDESEISTFLGNYETFSYDGAVEYNCKDISKYGLKEKNPATALIKLDYYELVDIEDSGSSDNSEGAEGENNKENNKENNEENNEENNKEQQETKQERVDYQAKIVIGNQNEDGDYYVRVNDSGYVYLMDEEGVDKLIPDKAYSYVEKTISRVSVDNMTKMIFTAGEKDYTITRKEKTSVNEDGEEETETDHFFNNKTMEASEFNALTVSWSTLETAKEMTEKQKQQAEQNIKQNAEKNTEKNAGETVLTVEIKGTGIEQTVKFFAFDKSYYAVKDGESMFFLADKRDVDAFIQKLEDLS